MGFIPRRIETSLGNQTRAIARAQELFKSAAAASGRIGTADFPITRTNAGNFLRANVAAGALGARIAGAVQPGGVRPVQELSRGIQPSPDGNITAAQRTQIINLLELSRQQGIAQGRAASVVRSTTRLSDQDAGGDRLRNYIAPNRRAPALTALAPSIQPTQELREFQWEYFDDGVNVSVNAQQASFTLQTPVDECWEIIWLTGRSSFATTVSVDIVHINNLISQTLARVDMTANLVATMPLLYGGNSERGFTVASSVVEWNGGPVTMLPGDQLNVLTGSAAPAAAHNFSVEIRWRKRPLPKTHQRSNLLVGVAV